VAEYSQDYIDKLTDDQLTQLISDVAYQMAVDETGAEEEDEIQEYGENSWYALMQQFESDLDTKHSIEELLDQAVKLGIELPKVK
jgi:hypothetical protein